MHVRARLRLDGWDRHRLGAAVWLVLESQTEGLGQRRLTDIVLADNHIETCLELHLF